MVIVVQIVPLVGVSDVDFLNVRKCLSNRGWGYGGCGGDTSPIGVDSFDYR
jgi:hypothetical protein